MASVEGVKPTRMELLKTRYKRRLAEKGHELLSEKRDALVVQFFDLLARRNRLRSGVINSLMEVYRLVQYSRLTTGDRYVDVMVGGVMDQHDLAVRTVNVMGVRIPQFIRTSTESPAVLNLVEPDLNLTKAYSLAQDLVEDLLLLAEIESAIEWIGAEIDKTKRRVNALEHVFIPRLTAMEKAIEAHLDEMEREEFFRRKRMKALLMEGRI